MHIQDALLSTVANDRDSLQKSFPTKAWPQPNNTDPQIHTDFHRSISKTKSLESICASVKICGKMKKPPGITRLCVKTGRIFLKREFFKGGFLKGTFS